MSFKKWKTKLITLAAILSLTFPAFGWLYFSGPPTLLPASTNYTSGRYNAYVSPFGVGSLVPGSWYNIAYYDASTFPNNVNFVFQYPTKPSASIFGYLFVTYCQYSGAPLGTPCQHLQVKNIPSLVERHSLKFYGNLDSYDTIADWYVTSIAATNWYLSTPEYEFEVFYHYNTLSQTFCSLTGGGITHYPPVTISGVSWNPVVRTTPTVNYGVANISFCADGYVDQPIGSYDLLAFVNWAVTNVSVPNTYYLHGVATGCEPHYDGGLCHVEQYSVTGLE